MKKQQKRTIIDESIDLVKKYEFNLTNIIKNPERLAIAKALIKCNNITELSNQLSLPRDKVYYYVADKRNRTSIYSILKDYDRNNSVIKKSSEMKITNYRETLKQLIDNNPNFKKHLEIKELMILEEYITYKKSFAAIGKKMNVSKWVIIGIIYRNKNSILNRLLKDKNNIKNEIMKNAKIINSYILNDYCNLKSPVFREKYNYTKQEWQVLMKKSFKSQVYELVTKECARIYNMSFEEIKNIIKDAELSLSFLSGKRTL